MRILGDEQQIINYRTVLLSKTINWLLTVCWRLLLFFYSLNKYNIAVYLVPTTSASLSPRTVVRDLLHPFSKGV